MTETIEIWLSNEQKTLLCGTGLGKTIYSLPLEILLSGDLGSGKTTFLQGLASGLGIAERIVSPTFALEQRYRMQTNAHSSEKKAEFIHIDLYRLEPTQARRLLHTTDDHHGIRCIEWWERAESIPTGPAIRITMTEKQHAGVLGRIVTIVFDDAKIPQRETIERWREDVMLPHHIRRHCDAVADLCDELAGCMLKRGIPVRPKLLRAAAEVHDLLRFLDFRAGGFAGEQHSPQELACWDAIRLQYPNLKHEPACAVLLESRDFSALAAIVAVHGLVLPSPERRTIEQQLLFYADKRVMVDKRVTLDERFADFAKRYSDSKRSEDGETWYREAKNVEADLFPDGCPV
jgi:tRNA threonylcarbamoyladenosine biosynthesis protein TsaE